MLCLWWPWGQSQTVTQVVTDTVFQQLVPDTIVTWRERLVFRTVKPDTVQITTTKYDTTRVQQFCEAATQSHDSVSVDSVPPVLPPFAGVYRGGQLALSTTRSDGSGYRQVQRVSPNFVFSARAHDILIQDRRTLPPWVGTTLRLTGCVGLGYGMQRLTNRDELGAAMGGGCVIGSLLPN